MRTVLIDNYDSFTYNLFQLMAEVNGVEPEVIGNDMVRWQALSEADFDAVVISPGPGRPEREADFGACAEVIRHCPLPLLGVCLGHQGIGWVHGAEIEHAPEPVHGWATRIEHSGAPLFAGIPSGFEAVRYHSLCLARPLPDRLQEIAWAQDGVPMAIAHRTRPQWGVQFHPESIATEHGLRLLSNFRDLARAHNGDARPAPPSRSRTRARTPAAAAANGEARPRLLVRPLPRMPDPERVFAALFGEQREAFWLDGEGAGPDARFSFLGDAGGPFGAAVSYDVEAGEVRIERAGAVERRRESIFDYLEAEIARLTPEAPDLPFAFPCGFVGFFGYELKAECGGDRAHRSPLPDAAFLFAGRMVAFDHEAGRAYLLCLAGDGPEDWIETAAAAVAGLGAAAGGGDEAGGGPPPAPPRLARSRERYLADIAACDALLREGESYEVCLTNRVEAGTDEDPLALYRRLRRHNPAPHSAYLRFGDLAVLSSSPERFIRVGAGGEVEARPIKGTCRRDPDPARDALLAAGLAASEKNRAENLMIADLLRNDLGSVCEVGSVHVPALAQVESFATVHQLVSTVRGRLRADLGATDAVRACFPPGSMTGAPKRRTMEIIDRLEGAPRGVYSGAIGYLGLDGGCDLSVAIRTIVLDRAAASVGAGGAIVLRSDPEEEFEEMLLKAEAPLRAIAADPAGAAPRPAGTASLA
jgi:para-aminobenzoate synthetase